MSKDAPAFPVEYSEACLMLKSGEQPRGLTKRELFAAMAMQGLCSRETWEDVNTRPQTKSIAFNAVAYADALLAELEKSK